MRPGMYMSCVDPHESRWGGLPPFYDEWNKKLGPALGPAKSTSSGIWERSFKHPELSKPTTVHYDTNTNLGTIVWADGPAGPPKIWPGGPPASPPAPPTPPAPPAPASCGAVRVDTGVGPDPHGPGDLGNKPASSVDECCAMCAKEKGCAIWAWHAEQKGKPCHFHAKGAPMHRVRGCYAGKMQ